MERKSPLRNESLYLTILYLLSSHFLELLIVCGSLAAALKQMDLRREWVDCVVAEGDGLPMVRAAVRAKMNSMKAIVVDDDGEVERETR